MTEKTEDTYVAGVPDTEEETALKIKPVYTLEELLEQIDESNLHLEQGFGPAVGREEW